MPSTTLCSASITLGVRAGEVFGEASVGLGFKRLETAVVAHCEPSPCCAVENLVLE
jgi:hypothetical protein